MVALPFWRFELAKSIFSPSYAVNLYLLLTYLNNEQNVKLNIWILDYCVQREWLYYISTCKKHQIRSVHTFVFILKLKQVYFVSIEVLWKLRTDDRECWHHFQMVIRQSEQSNRETTSLFIHIDWLYIHIYINASQKINQNNKATIKTGDSP